jgi:hypothetical protein
MPDPITFAVRHTGADRVLLLLHGFSGESPQTFGLLPAFLAGDPALAAWDLYCVGYPTSLAPDVTGVWAADPDLATLADYLRGLLAEGRFAGYRQVGFVAHNMGGLIVQRALVDADLGDRVSHVLLFGTPSAGLRKARLGALFKRQARDMTEGGPFVTGLRAAWGQRFGGGAPFHFCATAGLRDDFVPRASSVEVFPDACRRFVPGNHLEMVKPRRLDDDTVLLVRRALSGDSGRGGPGQGGSGSGGGGPVARAAGRPNAGPGGGRFPSAVVAGGRLAGAAATIGELAPRRAALAPDEAVRLALALEITGHDDDAVALLEERHAGHTELTGVLAGRYKRRWLADPEGRATEGPRARALYADAHAQAAAAGDHGQAFYNAINEAFMALALGAGAGDHTPDRQAAIAAAREVAERALAHAGQAARAGGAPDRWRLATEGEALLHLGDVDAALARYGDARAAGPDPREAGSMLQQGVWVARMLDRDAAEARLRALFADVAMV